MAEGDTNTMTHSDNKELSDGLGFYKPEDKVPGEATLSSENTPGSIEDRVKKLVALLISPKTLETISSEEVGQAIAELKSIQKELQDTSRDVNQNDIKTRLDALTDSFLNPKKHNKEIDIPIGEKGNIDHSVPVELSEKVHTDEQIAALEQKDNKPFLRDPKSEPKKPYKKPELREEESNSVLRRIAKIRDDINKEYDGGVIELEAQRDARLARLNEAEELINDGLAKLEAAAK